MSNDSVRRNKLAFLSAILVIGVGFQAVSQGKKVPPRPHHIICTPETLKPVKMVQPNYPDKAIQKGIEGRVVLELTVNKSGSVSGVTLIKGNSILAHAAMNAARQWQYQPYRLNDQPVEVTIWLEVDFFLSPRKR